MRANRTIKSRYFRLALVAVICMISSVSEAKNLYVNGASGNDSVTYANNDENHPWATIGRAAWGSTVRSSPSPSQAAQPGDTVLIAAGTYTINHRAVDFVDIGYNPINSGTPGNYIVFRGVGTVVLQNSSPGPLIGANGRHYIEWDNFTIYEVNAPPRHGSEYDHGIVTVNNSNYTRLLHLRLYGHVWPAADVHYAIFLNGTSTGTLVKNNYLQGFVRSSTLLSDDNGGGIMTYGTSDIVIENNEITGCGGGIYSKNAHSGDGYRHVIRYNLLYGNYKGVLLQEVHDAKVYQNIIRDGIGTNDRIGVKLQYERVLRAIIANNTFINLHAAWDGNVGTGVAAWEGNFFQNNIVYATTRGVQFENPVSFNPYASFDGNLYGSGTRWVYGSEFTTLSSWQSISERPDANSITGDPLFVDVASRNLRLQNRSPALMLGVDVLDLNRNGSTADVIPAGAYVTGNEIIGLDSGSLDRTPPSVPQNLQVRQ